MTIVPVTAQQRFETKSGAERVDPESKISSTSPTRPQRLPKIFFLVKNARNRREEKQKIESSPKRKYRVKTNQSSPRGPHGWDPNDEMETRKSEVLVHQRQIAGKGRQATSQT